MLNEQYLTPSEVAKELGVTLSRISHIIADKQLPVQRYGLEGKMILIRRSDVDRLIRDREEKGIFIK